MQPLKDLFRLIGLSLPFSKDFDLIEASVKVSHLVGIDMFYNIGVSPNPLNQTENKISILKPIQEFLMRVPSK